MIRLRCNTDGDRTRAHGKENPPLFCAVRRLRPTRVLSTRQLPTDHDYAVPTRGYQSDQPSHFLSSSPRPCCTQSLHCFITTRLHVKLDNVAPY